MRCGKTMFARLTARTPRQPTTPRPASRRRITGAGTCRSDSAAFRRLRAGSGPFDATASSYPAVHERHASDRSPRSCRRGHHGRSGGRPQPARPGQLACPASRSASMSAGRVSRRRSSTWPRPSWWVPGSASARPSRPRRRRSTATIASVVAKVLAGRDTPEGPARWLRPAGHRQERSPGQRGEHRPGLDRLAGHGQHRRRPSVARCSSSMTRMRPAWRSWPTARPRAAWARSCC